MTMANFQISSDMSVYFGGDNYDDVKERVKRMGEFRSYVSSRIREWFAIPYKTTVWIEIDHNGLASISGKYRFDTDNLSKMNSMLLSIVEAGGRVANVVTYGEIHFFEDRIGWEVRQ